MVQKVEQLFKREVGNFKERAVDLKDHTIYFEVNSNSDTPERTFILTHGAGGSGRFMNPIAQELINTVPNIKVIILDLPFHGYSIASESLEDYNVNDYTRVVNELLEKLKDENEIVGIAHWIGWSMGGSIGLLSNLSGNGIEELTLLNSSPIWESVPAMIETVPLMSDKIAIVEVFKSICESQVTVNTDASLAEAFMENYYDMIPTGEVLVRDFAGVTPEHFDIVAKLPNITAKTLVISGTKDPVAEMKYQDVMKNNIPDAELLMLEDDHCMLVKPYAVEIIVKAIADRFVK